MLLLLMVMTMTQTDGIANTCQVKMVEWRVEHEMERGREKEKKSK